jgi:Flp pilus assembly pilin Flp
MFSAIMELFRCRSGVTAIEYAMIAALIALAIFSGTQQIGGSVKQFFTTLAGSF